ncbi:unnamed protein product [Parnassius apollo]|uniref:(apollo) hypothetical protein n=1 Tax=Parnassius apollo TaxID=110799 RepID=A0A8S3WF30_PARAO|nr:unnamed protein product [Parnassius apollo]
MSNTEDFSDSGSEYQPIPGEIHTESETDTSCDENIMMPSSLSEPGTSKSRKSTAALEKSITNRKKTTCGYDLNWLNIRWLRFERNHPLQFQFKETLNADMPFYKVDLSKKQQGRPAYLCNIQQGPLYPSRRPVTIAKKKDMLDLLPYIPPIYHQFYKNLTVDIPTRSSTRNADERSSDDEITYD